MSQIDLYLALDHRILVLWPSSGGVIGVGCFKTDHALAVAARHILLPSTST